MIESAGVAIIDLNPTPGDPTSSPAVLCVRAYSNWDFPKGQLEPGEKHITAAIRETLEETSLHHGADYILLGTVAGSTTYGSGSKSKTATYYSGLRMSSKTPYLPVNPELGKPENDEYRWVLLEDLHQLMPSRLRKIVENIIAEAEHKKKQHV